MRNLLNFIKTTTIGGFLVLLPVVAVLVLIGIAVNSVVSVIAPLTAKLPLKTIGGVAAATVLAVRPYVHNDYYWQVYFDTNRVIREYFGEAGFPVPEQHMVMRSS